MRARRPSSPRVPRRPLASLLALLLAAGCDRAGPRGPAGPPRGGGAEAGLDAGADGGPTPDAPSDAEAAGTRGPDDETGLPDGGRGDGSCVPRRMACATGGPPCCEGSCESGACCIPNYRLGCSLPSDCCSGICVAATLPATRGTSARHVTMCEQCTREGEPCTGAAIDACCPGLFCTIASHTGPTRGRCRPEGAPSSLRFLEGEWQSEAPDNAWRMRVTWNPRQQRFDGTLTRNGQRSADVGFRVGERVWSATPSAGSLDEEQLFRSGSGGVSSGSRWQRGRVDLRASTPDRLVTSTSTFTRVP